MASHIVLTRRHFAAIAEVIRLLPSFETFEQDGSRYPCEVVNWDTVVARFAEMLSETNPRFDRARFENACRGREVSPHRIARAA